MAPINFVTLNMLLVAMTLPGNEARSHSMKLMTRPFGGGALCALDPPTLSTGMSLKVPDAPEAVRCSMTCAEDAKCKHFNYISTESNPCQLYHYRPINFEVSPNCQHFHQPGQHTVYYRFSRLSTGHN